MLNNKRKLEEAQAKDAILTAINNFGNCLYGDIVPELHKSGFSIHQNKLPGICKQIIDEKPYLSLIQITELSIYIQVAKGSKTELFLQEGGFTKEVRQIINQQKTKSVVAWATLAISAAGVVLAVIFH